MVNFLLQQTLFIWITNIGRWLQYSTLYDDIIRGVITRVPYLRDKLESWAHICMPHSYIYTLYNSKNEYHFLGRRHTSRESMKLGILQGMNIISYEWDAHQENLWHNKSGDNFNEIPKRQPEAWAHICMHHSYIYTFLGKSMKLGPMGYYWPLYKH